MEDVAVSDVEVGAAAEALAPVPVPPHQLLHVSCLALSSTIIIYTQPPTRIL